MDTVDNAISIEQYEMTPTYKLIYCRLYYVHRFKPNHASV